MLSFLFRIALLAFTWVVATSVALAHRPYLSSERAPLVLENGTPAELCLLHGDGILAFDPVRPIVMGDKGEIYALGPHGEAIAFTCAEQDCRVFVYMAGSSLPHVFISTTRHLSPNRYIGFPVMIRTSPISPNGRKR